MNTALTKTTKTADTATKAATNAALTKTTKTAAAATKDAMNTALTKTTRTAAAAMKDGEDMLRRLRRKTLNSNLTILYLS